MPLPAAVTDQIAKYKDVHYTGEVVSMTSIFGYYAYGKKRIAYITKVCNMYAFEFCSYGEGEVITHCSGMCYEDQLISTIRMEFQSAEPLPV